MTSRRTRLLAMVSALVVAIPVLAGCEISASGEGTVLVTSDSAATTYTSTTGTVARVCAVTSATCEQTDAYLYSYYPETGETEWTVYPGFPVVDRSGQTVGLPAGRYTLQATEYRPAAVLTNAVQINVYALTQVDLTIWHQAYGRGAVDASCQEGWEPSWAAWPNDGTGGFICNRQVYAYHPDVPVR